MTTGPVSETLTGQGKVFKGSQFIADAHYEVHIQPQYKTTRTMDGDGRYFVGNSVSIRVTPPTTISKHFGTDKLTLYLSDGRKQDFFVADSNGGCRATGGPYQ